MNVIYRFFWNGEKSSHFKSIYFGNAIYERHLTCYVLARESPYWLFNYRAGELSPRREWGREEGRADRGAPL